MDFFNVAKVRQLEGVIKTLQARNVDLIKIDQHIKDDCDHRIREVDHMLGLERKRHEMELEEAVRNTHWDASQKLEQEKDRHIEQMLNTINKHHEEIISRLPTVHVDRHITQGKRTDST